MLIIDDLLLSPFRGMLWVVRQVHLAAQQEVAGEAESIGAELRDLYMMLETGKISADQYDLREKVLLDQLEELQHVGAKP